MRERVTELETELKTKSEQLVASESATLAQRSDLANDVKVMRNALDDKHRELEQSQRRLAETGTELSAATQRCEALGESLREETGHGGSLQEELASLQEQMKSTLNVITFSSN
ncbi:PREDICTED: early endosome antigen 1-like [Priapulus caudatus]|uniref:Early endosome antigen 1-like n=1 Tax=Priapulus caudatus TaxID=37621 RepID=A0ABM1F400_PRICU|nr:PREDICTED: early endosome antigen 1-like [Priapulus caudatus]